MSVVAFSTLAVVTAALCIYLALHELRLRARRARPKAARRRRVPLDPRSERAAERRARSLLRSIVNREEWEMYRDLGFIRAEGRCAVSGAGSSSSYCYLIYPHKPIVAYLPGSNSLLSEYCVEFPDPSRPVLGPKLPDSDDVLAKWMMIRADEGRLIGDANMHLPGRQVDPQQVRRDLWRLAEWERERARHPSAAWRPHAGSARARSRAQAPPGARGRPAAGAV